MFRLYQPMLLTLLMFGYDFNFFNKNKLTRVAAKIYCIIVLSIVSYTTIACCESQGIIQSWTWSLAEYSSSVLIILFFNSQMDMFLKKLNEIDIYLRIRRKHYFMEKYKMFILTAVVWVLRIAYTYLYCTFYVCYKDLSLYIVSLIAPLALDVSRVWRCILFDVIRYRLKMLRQRLEENPQENYYLYVKNNRTLREDKLKFCLYLYRNLADLVELVSLELHASLCMSVVCSLPKLISDVYQVLAILEGSGSKRSVIFILIHMLQICGLLFGPFVIVELYAVEVEKMKEFLIHKYIDENDTELREQIDIFLRYIEIRPFRYKIWRIIPINMSAPLEMINLCTTYVIVVINFTHLYD